SRLFLLACAPPPSASLSAPSLHDALPISFLFVLNPEKAAVYPDKLRDGIHYDRSWVQQFEQKLDELGVNYIDNTQLLQDRRAEGDRKSTRLNSSHVSISYAVFCLKKKT